MSLDLTKRILLLVRQISFSDNNSLVELAILLLDYLRLMIWCRIGQEERE